MKKALVILVIVILAFGMYYYFTFQQLDYTIENVSINDVEVMSASITIYLRVSNLNPLPLYLTSTTFDVYINGNYAGHGSTSSTTISGNSYRTIRAPIMLTFTGLSTSVVNIILNGGLVKMEIHGDASLFVVNIPFHISDTVNLV